MGDVTVHISGCYLAWMIICRSWNSNHRSIFQYRVICMYWRDHVPPHIREKRLLAGTSLLFASPPSFLNTKMQSMNKPVTLFVALILLFNHASNSWGEKLFIPIDLGTGYPFGINNSGQVVGNLDGHAFFYSNGQKVDMGMISTSFQSAAYGINSSGQIAGKYQKTFYSYSNPFVFTNAETIIDLSFGTSPFNGTAYCINDAGWVAGSSSTGPNGEPQHAFLYRDGQMKDLGVIDGWRSVAYSINTSGQVVGESSVSWSGPFHAFLYDEGKMIDIGKFLPFNGSRATGINAVGQITGYAFNEASIDDNIETHSFIYDKGAITDLGSLGGITTYAYGINSSGQVVGRSYTTAPYTVHAFLFADGQIKDLNDLIPFDSGWELWGATAINDLGQIVAYGYNAEREGHAILLTPIPEPSSFTLLVVGLFVLAWRIRPKRKS
jgi:probable HAF family extracellular repeat protein